MYFSSSIFISQYQYSFDIINKFGMNKSKKKYISLLPSLIFFTNIGSPSITHQILPHICNKQNIKIFVKTSKSPSRSNLIHLKIHQNYS